MILIDRNKGAIVNVASISTHLPTPYYAVYVATKSFVEKLTESLQYEYSDTKIHFQCLTPCVVRTKMTMDMDYENVKNYKTNALSYAKHALTTLGYAPNTCGHWYHGYQVIYLYLA